MSSWLENDLRIVELDCKIKHLTEQFNKKYGEDIENYYKKLERFLKNKLKFETSIILRGQITMTSYGIISNRKV